MSKKKLALGVSALDSKGRTIWIADAHRGDGKRYLENKLPGKEKEPDWLPAPAGNFSIWIRAYWPDNAILDGTWQPPVVVRRHGPLNNWRHHVIAFLPESAQQYVA